MSKKILCLVLSLAMLTSIFAYASEGSADERLAGAGFDLSRLTDGYSALQTFDGKSEDFVIGSYGDGVIDPDTGKMDIVTDTDSGKFRTHLVSNEEIESENFVIEFEVARTGNFDLYSDAGYLAGTNGQYGIEVAVKKAANADYAPLSQYGVLLPVTTNEWGETYKYKIVVNEANFKSEYEAAPEEIKGNSIILKWGQKLMTSYYMAPGATKYTQMSGVTSHGASTIYTHKVRYHMGSSIAEGAAYPDSGEVNITFHVSANYPAAGKPEVDFSEIGFTVDNIKVYPLGKSFADNVRYMDENDEELKEVADGIITPVFDMVNNGDLEEATAITAAYDESDNLVAYNEVKIEDIASGESEIRGASIEIVDAENVARVEAFVWTSVGSAVPVSGTRVLGKMDEIEGSATEINIGEEYTGNTYSFESFDRYTSGNTITVEGVHGKGKKTTVTAVVMGNETDDILTATQFKTDADGSFKKSITINPELVGENETATVMFKAIDTNPKYFAVPVRSDWADMAEDFDLMTNGEDADSFYNTYKDNFGYYKSGEEEITAVDISGLDEIDYSNLAFVKGMREYDDLTYGEIAAEAVALIDALADIDEFMTGFEDAKALSTQAEKIEAIKALTQNCEFMTFSTAGVSNVDAICKAMILSDAETISDFYDDFTDAYETQKTAEEKSVPGFTGISSANEMKSFFEDYKTVLGVEISGYDSKDYAVMFSAFEEKAFEGCEDYGAVNEAIVFLQNYVADYNGLVKAVEDAKTVAEEWNGVKAFIENPGEYVTVALADAYIFEKASNEEVICKRVKDMGYSKLSEVADAMEASGEEDDAKAKCLDDITEASNATVGTGTGRWSIIEEQVELAIKNDWISPDTSGKVKDEVAVFKRMAKMNFAYLPDIEKAYEDAYAAQIKSEKKESSGGGGGGGGGGGISFGGNTASGSDGKITSGNSGASGDKEILNMSADIVKNETEISTNQNDHPNAPFKDVTDDYKWASAAINGLRKYGLVNGDGSGSFRPGKGISREEFLKILLNVFAVEVKEGSVTFADVDKNAWYADYVATAAEMGIVKGYADGTFGIGDTISRADMAVMIYRTMDIMEISVDPTREGFMFKDTVDIPDYARDSISILQQAGVLNGDTFGYYNPLNNVTRAEAAVALWTVHGAIKDILTYSWTNPY